MKTAYKIEIQHDENLYQTDIKDYIQTAINSYRGGLHLDDARRSIACLKIRKIEKVEGK